MKKILLVLALALSGCAGMGGGPPDPQLLPLQGKWKVYVNGVPQSKGQKSQTGGYYTNDFHYEFVVSGDRVVVSSVADSDDDQRYTLKGDRSEIAWFSVEGRRVRGAWLKQDMAGAFSEDFSELTVRWTDAYAYTDYDHGIRLQQTEVMRHQ